MANKQSIIADIDAKVANTKYSTWRIAPCARSCGTQGILEGYGKGKRQPLVGLGGRFAIRRSGH
ncbi:MAG: hypothetical protein ACREEL_00030 [Stellaceae bacterium]